MASLNKDHIVEALRSLKDRASGRDFVEMGIVRKASACDGYASLTLACPPDETQRDAIRAEADAAIRRRARELGAPIHALTIDFVEPARETQGQDAMPRTMEQPAAVPLKQAASTKTISSGSASAGAAFKHVIAVGAGKGGVGKSTIAVNLAVGLAREGHAVGLLDGDIYGPSGPTLMGLASMDVLMQGNMLQPFLVHGVKTMTIGKLVDPEKPLIWRGPMAHGAFKQLVEQTQWGDLDYLIIDLPPGTGDVPLTMSQLFALTGAVIVCTPQRVAQDDAVRAARMFQTLNIPVLGVVENMSYFIGDDGKEYDLFGRGGAEHMAQRLALPFLGAVPIHMELRTNSDAGTPLKNFSGNKSLYDSLVSMTARVEQEAALATLRAGKGTTLTVN